VENNELSYTEILNRMFFFMDKANLSARATSLKLGNSEAYIKRILNEGVELKVKTLMEFCEVVGITLYDFFYLGKDYNKDDKYILDMYSKLSPKNKQTIIDLLKNLK